MKPGATGPGAADLVRFLKIRKVPPSALASVLAPRKPEGSGVDGVLPTADHFSLVSASVQAPPVQPAVGFIEDR